MKNIQVTATALARHLGVTRQYVERLADDGVIARHHDGFDQDQSRLQYLAWLRAPERRSARVEADAHLRRLKARALELKIGEQQGLLMEHAEHITIITELVGMFRSELSGFPARLTRDLTVRRAAEAEIFAMLHRLAVKAGQMAAAKNPTPEPKTGNYSAVDDNAQIE